MAYIWLDDVYCIVTYNRTMYILNALDVSLMYDQCAYGLLFKLMWV